MKLWWLRDFSSFKIFKIQDLDVVAVVVAIVRRTQGVIRGISERKVRDRYLCDNCVYCCNKRTWKIGISQI